MVNHSQLSSKLVIFRLSLVSTTYSSMEAVLHIFLRQGIKEVEIIII